MQIKQQIVILLICCSFSDTKKVAANRYFAYLLLLLTYPLTNIALPLRLSLQILNNRSVIMVPTLNNLQQRIAELPTFTKEAENSLRPLFENMQFSKACFNREFAALQASEEEIAQFKERAFCLQTTAMIRCVLNVACLVALIVSASAAPTRVGRLVGGLTSFGLYELLGMINFCFRERLLKTNHLEDGPDYGVLFFWPWYAYDEATSKISRYITRKEAALTTEKGGMQTRLAAIEEQLQNPTSLKTRVITSISLYDREQAQLQKNIDDLSTLQNTPVTAIQNPQVIEMLSNYCDNLKGKYTQDLNRTTASRLRLRTTLDQLQQMYPSDVESGDATQ
jgi:hypothetical protein